MKPLTSWQYIQLDETYTRDDATRRACALAYMTATGADLEDKEQFMAWLRKTEIRQALKIAEAAAELNGFGEEESPPGN